MTTPKHPKYRLISEPEIDEIIYSLGTLVTTLMTITKQFDNLLPADIPEPTPGPGSEASE